MKKEFTPGMYCKFPNEQIPRILDILRANGHKVWNHENVFNQNDNAIVLSSDGDLHGIDCNEYRFDKQDTELSRHTFMVIALRLEEGMGILFNETTTEQRKHIQDSFVELGVKCDAMPEHLEKYCYLFSDGEWMSCQPYHIKKAISYLDWCKRLCVEPIGNEPTAEPVFDPSKPFEGCFDPDGEEWQRFEVYIGYDKQCEQHVVGTHIGYTGVKFIRNIQEFNASMLKVGEGIIVNSHPCHYGKLFVMLPLGVLYCFDTRENLKSNDETIKGRKVEIKVVETKTTKP